MTSAYPVPTIIPERRNEVWEQPGGDWEVAYFDLPTPVNIEHVHKAGIETWHKWVDQKYKQERQRPLGAPRVKGPFRLPNYDSLDKARYYLLARWEREKPKLISIDTAALLAEMPINSGQQLKGFIAQMEAMVRAPFGEIERQAAADRRLKDIAREDEEWNRRNAALLARRLRERS